MPYKTNKCTQYTISCPNTSQYLYYNVARTPWNTQSHPEPKTLQRVYIPLILTFLSLNNISAARVAEWLRWLIHYRPWSFDHLTAVTGVGSSPTRVTSGTSQVLLARESGGFSGVLPFSPHLLIGSSRYEWNNLERDVKLNKKKKKKKKKKKINNISRIKLALYATRKRKVFLMYVNYCNRQYLSISVLTWFLCDISRINQFKKNGLWYGLDAIIWFCMVA